MGTLYFYFLTFSAGPLRAALPTRKHVPARLARIRLREHKRAPRPRALREALPRRGNTHFSKPSRLPLNSPFPRLCCTTVYLLYPLWTAGATGRK